MGDSSNSKRKQAYANQSAISSQQFGLGYGALEGGIGYLSDIYKQGGTDLSEKFGLRQTDIMDAAAQASGTGSFQNAGEGVFRGAGSRMTGIGANTLEKGTQTIDQMNRLRSMLSGQGLQTTGLSQTAGDLTTRAISLLDPNPTLSLIKAFGAGASSLYGAYGQGQGGGQGLPTAWSMGGVNSYMPQG